MHYTFRKKQSRKKEKREKVRVEDRGLVPTPWIKEAFEQYPHESRREASQYSVTLDVIKKKRDPPMTKYWP